jgi:hypothetical protein
MASNAMALSRARERRRKVPMPKKLTGTPRLLALMALTVAVGLTVWMVLWALLWSPTGLLQR